MVDVVVLFQCSSFFESNCLLLFFIWSCLLFRNELLIRFDHDGDGSINYLEFVNFCLAYAMDDPKKGGTKSHLTSHGDRDAHESKLMPTNGT